MTPYTVTLRYFAPSEAMNIIDVMGREFPGYRSHTLMSSDTATRRYSYLTSAQPHKMEQWLTILLGDMGLNPDTDVNIAIEGVEITMEKLTPPRGARVSPTATSVSTRPRRQPRDPMDRRRPVDDHIR